MKWTLVAFCATSALASERLLDVSLDGTRALVYRWERKDRKFLDQVDTLSGHRIASVSFSYDGVVSGRLVAPGVASVIAYSRANRLLQWDISRDSLREVAIAWPKDWTYLGVGAGGALEAEVGKSRMPRRWDGRNWLALDAPRCGDKPGRGNLRAAPRDGAFLLAVDDQMRDDSGKLPSAKANVIIESPRDCTITRAFAIAFPEEPRQKAPLLAPKNKYWANIRMGRGGWGELVAISPDARVLAVAYSIKTDGVYSNILAKIAFFSMADGKRIDAFQVAILRDNVFTHLFPVPNADPISTGPWSGALRFSADGKWLYGSTSKFHRIKVPD